MKKLFILLLCIITLTACGTKVNKEEVKEKLYIQFDEEKLKLNIGDCFDYAAAIKNTNGNIQPISDICAVVTEAGEYEYTYRVCDKEHSDICKEVTVVFTVLARKGPVITFNKIVELTAGEKPDILKGVVAVDQDGKRVDVEVVGEWDSQVPGTYQLIYRAVDSEGFSTDEPFTLIVLPKEDNSNEKPILCPTGDFPQEECNFIPYKAEFEASYYKIFWEETDIACKTELVKIDSSLYEAGCHSIVNNEKKIVGWGLSRKER